jgi:hypothetical protein
VARRTRAALGRNGPELDTDGVPRLLEVREAVAVATNAAELRATAAKRTARETEPEVLLEVALGAVREAYPNVDEQQEIKS